MLAPVSKTSHSPTTDAAPGPARRAVEPEDSPLAQLQALADQSVATARLKRLSNSANQTQPIPTQRRSRGTTQLVGSTSLQRGPMPDGQVQAPAIVGARNIPVRSAEMDKLGISATQMSNANYAAWTETAQCKMGLHGAYSHGGVTTVTQLKNRSDVLQGWFLKPKHKAILLIIEGVLTLAASGVALGLAISTGAIPAIVGAVMGIGIGAMKIARAAIDLWPIDQNLSQAEKDQIKEKRTNWKNLIRGVESALAMVGAAMVLTDPTRLKSGVSLAIFAVAKAVRSVATHMARNDAPGVPSRAAKVAAVAHVIETAALGVAGGFTIGSGVDVASNPRIGAGAVMGAVAVSKGFRAADQTKDAFNPQAPAAAAGGPAPAAPAPAPAAQPDAAVNPAPEGQPEQLPVVAQDGPAAEQQPAPEGEMVAAPAVIGEDAPDAELNPAPEGQAAPLEGAEH